MILCHGTRKLKHYFIFILNYYGLKFALLINADACGRDPSRGFVASERQIIRVAG